MGRLLPDSELLERLVAFDSTSRNSNLPIADFLAGYLDRPGVRIERNPSPDGTKTNLIAWAGPPPARRTVAGSSSPAIWTSSLPTRRAGGATPSP